MKICLFDFGSFNGTEVGLFVRFCQKNDYDDYEVYAFEAHPEYAKNIRSRFKSIKRLHILNLALSDKNEKVRLYLEKSGHGNSIFADKENVNINKYIDVQGFVFSHWVTRKIPDFDKQFNIIRFNIEGAEWYLINDLIDSGLYKHINLLCGGRELDMCKIDSLRDKMLDYHVALRMHNLKVEHFDYFTSYQDLERLLLPRLPGGESK